MTLRLQHPLRVNITASDPDNDILDWSFIESPQYGTTDKIWGTVVKGDEFTYTSNNLLSSTTDTLKISVTDFIVAESIKVIINITADNDPPYIPNFDTIRVVRNQDCKFHILGVDPEGFPLTWEITIQPVNGTLTKLADTLTDTIQEAQYKLTCANNQFMRKKS